MLRWRIIGERMKRKAKAAISVYGMMRTKKVGKTNQNIYSNLASENDESEIGMMGSLFSLVKLVKIECVFNRLLYNLFATSIYLLFYSD